MNIGAAGTFVIRKRVGRVALRAELMRRLPFETDVMMCEGAEVLRLFSADPFAGQPSGSSIIRFVTVLAKRSRPSSPIPFSLPSSPKWCLKVLACRGQFVCGLYRREMKAISYLGQLEKIFGVPVTTRNWNTIAAIVRILKET